jgi:hypothetical protein
MPVQEVRGLLVELARMRAQLFLSKGRQRYRGDQGDVNEGRGRTSDRNPHRSCAF